MKASFSALMMAMILLSGCGGGSTVITDTITSNDDNTTTTGKDITTDDGKTTGDDDTTTGDDDTTTGDDDTTTGDDDTTTGDDDTTTGDDDTTTGDDDTTTGDDDTTTGDDDTTTGDDDTTTGDDDTTTGDDDTTTGDDDTTTGDDDTTTGDDDTTTGDDDTTTGDDDTTTGDDDTTEDDNSTQETASFIDSAVEGVSYKTAKYEGTTNSNGEFTYQSNDDNVTLSLGGITLGSYKLSNLNSDHKLFVGELLGSSRDDTTNSQVILLLQLLQSLDEDGDALNGITIESYVASDLADTSLDLRNSSVTEADLQKILTSLDRDLRSKEYAVTYYEIYLNSIGYSVDTIAPIFLSQQHYSVNENQTTAFTVDVLDATKVTYSLSGDDAAEFTIDSKNGTVKFKNAPDFETKSKYSFNVVATDETDKKTTQAVTIDINDLSEDAMNVPTLVVVMNWTNYSENDASLWHNKFFNLKEDSVNNWFNETLGGALAIVPVTESSGTKNDGIVMVDMGKKHPGGSDNTAFRDTEVVNAIKKVDKYVDFSSYDVDGNGILNMKELQIIFIVAGGEEAYGDPQDHSIWAFQWSFSSNSGPEVDGVSIMQYSSDPAKNGTFARFGANHGDHKAVIGIIAHEMGHAMLDLRDYYDNGGGTGLGWYDIMSGGSWARKNGDDYAGQTPTQYSAFNRVETGVNVNLQEVSNTQTLTIDCSSNNVVKLVTSQNNEYFMFECRDTSEQNSDISFNYFDEDFTEDRLFGVLYHIDEDKDNNHEDGRQTSRNHYKVALVEKDTSTLMTSSTDASADFDDVYIVGDTIPSSKTELYDGTKTGYSLEVTAEDTTNRTMTIKITKN